MKSSNSITYAFALVLSLFNVQLIKADSQAHNHTSPLKTDVNTSTGVFQFSHPVIHTQGRLTSFALSLNYRYNRKGRFGLPEGWQFDIHHIDNKTLNLDGQQWRIDPTWHDESSYASGLKYQNQHGILFKDEGVGKPIPSDPTRFYRYCLSHKDGSVSYFSEEGLLILSLDRFNNRIEYEYLTPIESIEKAKIRRIKDNYGQSYLFDYDPGAITITYPDNRKFVIYHRVHGVHELVNPLKQAITFKYIQQGNTTLIENLQTPSGLLLSLTYKSIKAKNSEGTVSLPVVSSFTHRDLKTQQLLKQRNYKYAEEKNFTGYPKYIQNDNNDSLFDSNDRDYRYSVTVEENNLEDKPLFRTRQYTYNALHLPIEIITRYQGKAYSRTVYEYNISPFKYSQSTNFDKPKTITHQVHDEKNNQWLDRTKHYHKHDLFGNLIQTEHHVYDPNNKHWVLISTKSSSYFTNFYSLAKETLHTDYINGISIKRSYGLSA
ncbi:MAG: hypothetical protein OXE99_04425, partial [Cellvibrionales bacterium]|nr:hypothetical protein [Cellvibrionales bacterium]